MVFHLDLRVFWLSVLAVALIIIVDTKTWSRFLRLYRELTHEGRLDAADALIERQRWIPRPFVGLVLWFKSPGSLDRLQSHVQFQAGRIDEALVVAGRAIKKAGRNHQALAESLNLQSLCLMELVRYDDARAAIAKGREAGGAVGADVMESRLALLTGNLDEAVRLGTRAAEDSRGYIGRTLASVALNCKGNPQGALALLQENPPGIWVHYQESALKKLERSSAGRELIDQHQKEWSGVLEPMRFLYAGLIYAELKDLDSLRFVLDKAGASMGGLPVVRAMHKSLEVLLCAGLGRVEETERCLREGLAILDGPILRASKGEFHRSAGRAQLALGRAKAAVAEFEAALQLSLHPLEKHINRFWLARANDALGDREKAAELFRLVAADGIPSKYAAEANLFRP